MKLATLKSSLSVLRPALPTISGKSWRRGKTTNERGYTYRWQKARERFLFNNPLCRYCEREGRVELAVVVDHIVPHRGNPEIFWDESRWQPLCKNHHDSQKQREERGSPTHHPIGADGWPAAPGAGTDHQAPGGSGRTSGGDSF